MGYGDDLLVTALAAIEKKKYPERQIVIGNINKRNAFHSVIYDNNPNISNCNKLDKNKEVHIINYHSENRPYIDYTQSTNKKYFWNTSYRAVPGELFFSKEENILADNILKDAIKFWSIKNLNKKPKAIIFLETNSTKIKHKNFSIKHINKSWSPDGWVSLVNLLKDNYLFINSVHDYSMNIDGVYSPKSMDFRTACSVMNKCDLYVGPEGGFSHVAGALRKKAVVYYGGWIDPKIIGYSFHINLYFEHKSSPCGLYREVCTHCDEARKSITVRKFKNSIESIFI